MEHLIEVRGLQKAYRPGHPILTDVTLTLARGEYAVLLGLSGAGKSTFLRCLNGLVTASAGEILVPGAMLGARAATVDLARASQGDLRRWRRQVGMIFQQFNLVKRLTVLENVLAGSLGHAGWRGALHLFSARERAQAMAQLERVNLLDYAYQRADTLSGGQQQRVAIARALMQRPALILADEPIASLDPKLSHQILELLKQVAREDGLTVVVSLHALEFARSFGDRLIGFQGGRIVFDGPPSALDDDAVARIYHRGSARLQPER